MNLADWLKRSRPPTSEQVAMVASLAQAVEDGHREGHQFAGWSPSRIQLRDGGVDLSALEGGRPQEDLAYTAPETADGGAHTPRSDVYSAGVILYEILAGSHPFGGLSVKQPRGAPKPLGDVRRDLPKDLADAVTACLERDPEWRPADLSYVLRVAQDAGAVASKPAPRAAAAPPATGRVPVAGRRDATPSLGGRSGGSSSPSSSSRLPLLIVLLVVVLAGGGAAAYFFLGLGGNGGGATPAPTRVAAATEASPTPETIATPEAATPRPAPTLPSLADKTPGAGTATAAPLAQTPTPAPVPTPTPAPTAAATRVAVATAPPATAPPTAEPTAAATAPPAEPAVVKSIAPPKVRRGQRQLVDVRGEHLRADLQARFQHKGRAVAGVEVARQKAADPGLLQMLLVVGAEAPTGSYSLSLVDAQGRVSNAVVFEVVQ